MQTTFQEFCLKKKIINYKKNKENNEIISENSEPSSKQEDIQEKQIIKS